MVVQTKIKPNIRELSEEGLSQWLSELGQPGFRKKQISEWLWQKRVMSFEEMTSLPLDLRYQLSEHFRIPAVKTDTAQKSQDGTIKFGFLLEDGYKAEGVLIPSGDRMTACISSQVGCSLSCNFCATGTMDLRRNINFDEIFDQVTIIENTALKEYGHHLSNVVFMGMGEPMLNYKNVIAAIERLTTPGARNLSPRRITVSTVGITKMMKKLADEDTGVNLALSLHAAIDEKRNKIMSINESNPLSELKDALLYYAEKSGNMVFLEYLMLNNLNNGREDLDALEEFCSGLKCKINLIEYNPVSHADFERAETSATEWFRSELEKRKIRASIRRSRGMDIDAACGQLATKEEQL